TYVAALSHAVRPSPDKVRMMKWLTRGAPYLALGAVVVGVAVADRRGGAWGDIAKVLVALGVGLLLFEGCRLVLARYRPGGPLIHRVPDSFPSGHVANAALCVVTAAHLVGLQQ